jgi:plasmid replication initiation protein
MGNLIVKDNALITASHKLGEVEQRLILLAILKAREFCDSVEALKDKELIIHADDYLQNFGSTQQGAYKALRQAVIGLFEAKWGYKYINDKGNVEVVYERFTQSAKYIEKEATVKFMFANAIIPLLVQLERNFTSYDIKQVSELSSQYAMRLYEFFMQHLDKKTGKGWLAISLDDLRFRFGLLPTEYKRMCDFKRDVLELSLNQINEHTDLTASYTQKKEGRKIVGFKFEFVRPVDNLTILKTLETPKATSKPLDVSNSVTALNDTEKELIAEANSYADSIEASTAHRKNLVKKALKDHRQAEAEQQAEQARLEAQEQEQEQKKDIGKQMFEKILADSVLINRYAINVLAKRNPSGLQSIYLKQGDLVRAFEMEKIHFDDPNHVDMLIKLGF